MIALLTLVAILQAGVADAPEWPCWRGPAGDNVSVERGWSSEGAAEPRWRAQVGRGHSSVVIAGGRLFTQGFDEEHGVDRISCLDVENGHELWRHEYPARLDANGHGGGTHATPTYDDGRIYSFERQGVLRALSAADGKLLWQHDLVKELDVHPTDYGFGSSVVVAGELLVVNAQSVVALEGRTGETRWRSSDLGAYYSTPAVIRLADVPIVASFDRRGLDLLDLASGALRGHFAFVKGQTAVSAATPVTVGAGRLFISSSYGHGAALVDVSAPEPVAVWETKAMRTQLNACVLVDGALYGFDETVLKCLDLEGKERWRTRGTGMGALTAADGRLIVLSGNGELLVVAATPEEYRELSRRRVLTGSTFWASPVLCGGCIYVRSGEGELACLDHRARR